MRQIEIEIPFCSSGGNPSHPAADHVIGSYVLRNCLEGEDTFLYNCVELQRRFYSTSNYNDTKYYGSPCLVPMEGQAGQSLTTRAVVSPAPVGRPLGTPSGQANNSQGKPFRLNQNRLHL